MFVFKITGVNMHTTQALLTLLNNVQGLSFRLKSCSFRFFFYFFVVSKNNTFSDGKETVTFPEEAVR